MANIKKAFPLILRGQFVELEVGKKTRFIELDYLKFDRNKFERLKNINCLEDSILGEYLNILGKQSINEDVSFLYKLQTYFADKNLIDLWEFNESITNYEQFVFTDFNELLSFCNAKFNIRISDFVPKHETNLP